jgi:hypothetical protein
MSTATMFPFSSFSASLTSKLVFTTPLPEAMIRSIASLDGIVFGCGFGILEIHATVFGNALGENSGRSKMASESSVACTAHATCISAIESMSPSKYFCWSERNFVSSTVRYDLNSASEFDKSVSKLGRSRAAVPWLVNNLRLQFNIRMNFARSAIISGGNLWTGTIATALLLSSVAQARYASSLGRLGNATSRNVACRTAN